MEADVGVNHLGRLIKAMNARVDIMLADQERGNTAINLMDCIFCVVYKR
jgi:hypothetical protein